MNKKIFGIFVVMILIGINLSIIGFNLLYVTVDAKSNVIENYITVQNGAILDQQLDENSCGYTVMCVWGSYYDMGYAHAELLEDYIIHAFQEVKDSLGEKYNQARDLAKEAIWMPQEIEDEIDGMVDYCKVAYPSEYIDEYDIKACQLAGEYWYQGCRAHTCWGRYVSEPVKTLSTMRLDWDAFVPSLHHHVLCAHCPNDGSPDWISLGFPGVVGLIRGVNEFGIMVGNHDYDSYDLDLTLGRISRGITARYALTFSTDIDLSKHLANIYIELQGFEVMSGGFLNFYAPEGHGGVMTSNPFESGPDFYDVRKPMEDWHHGEAMITTNKWTDGTYTPFDEDFGADFFYNDESPKTLESHWDLLHSTSGGWKGLNQISIAYRGRGDMTIWVDGKISNLGQRTPRLEWEWTDLFIAEPPSIPIIYGQHSGKNGVEYKYIFTSVDSSNDDINYIIDWGDESDLLTIGPFGSGVEASASHIWMNEGNYIIKAKARDIYGVESDWAILEISMPKDKEMNLLLTEFLQNLIHRFPFFEKILNKIL